MSKEILKEIERLEKRMRKIQDKISLYADLAETPQTPEMIILIETILKAYEKEFRVCIEKIKTLKWLLE